MHNIAYTCDQPTELQIVGIQNSSKKIDKKVQAMSGRLSQHSRAPVFARSMRVKRCQLHDAVCRGDIHGVTSMVRVSTRGTLNNVDSYGMTALHYAAKYGHTDVALILLDNGASIDLKTSQGGALQTALRHRKGSVASALLAHSASATLTDADGMNALHLAVNNRLTGLVTQLLQTSMVDINVQDVKGNTALHYAAINGDVNVCKALMDQGASIDITNSSEETALHLAAGERNKNIVETLVNTDFGQLDISKEKFINMIRDDKKTALLLAAQMGNFEIMKVLIDHGAGIHGLASDKKSALHLAAASGNENAVKILLDKGVLVDQEDEDRRMPLHDAIFAGCSQIVRLLIATKASVNAEDKDGATPFLVAAQKNNFTVAKLLLQSGADVLDQDGYLKTGLHYAVENDSYEFAAFLVEKNKMLLLEKDENNQTPIHYAAQLGHSKILKLFIERTMQVDDIDNSGESALHLAAQYGHDECVELLIKDAQQDTLNICNGENHTPLHLAVIYNQPSVCLALFREDTDVDPIDRSGWTPLLYAVSHEDLSVLKILIEHNANLNFADKWGNTCLMIAAERDHAKAVSLLLESGADLQCINRDGDNFFDLAIDLKRKSACKAILESSRWQEALSSKDCNGSHFMQKLIEKQPDLAETVLDRSTIFSEHHPDDPDLQVTFDFRFLEESPESKSLISDTVEILTNERNNLYFAPKIMCRYGREKLTCHPVVSALMSIKHTRLSRYFYYLKFGLFIIFNVLLNLLIVEEAKDTIQMRKLNARYTNLNATNLPQLKKAFASSQNAYRSIGFLVFSIAVFQIATEVVKLIVLRHKYFYNIENFVELTLYLSAVWHLRTFLFQASEAEEPYAVIILCIFLAWTNHLLYLKGLPMYGIYVSMFLKVCFTIIKLIVLFGVIFLAFALIFYLLHIDESGFQRAGDVVTKILVMMTGEFEFSTWLVDNSTKKTDNFPKLPYKELSFIAFVLFVLLVSVAFTNLLIGLAVGDIESIQSSAKMEYIKQNLSLIDSIQGIMPKYMLKKYVNVATYTYAINRQSKFQRLIKFLKSDTLDDELKRLRTKKIDYETKELAYDKNEPVEVTYTNERLDRLEKLMAKVENQLSNVLKKFEEQLTTPSGMKTKEVSPEIGRNAEEVLH